MPKLNLSQINIHQGSSYPEEYAQDTKNRRLLALGDAGGLTQFGANLVTLAPGAWASQRHAHSAEDELVYILSGHPTLIDDTGETTLSPHDVCAHPAGDANAHHLINHTLGDVVFLVIGTRNAQADDVTYPDVDMQIKANNTSKRQFSRKDGSLF